MPRKSALPLTEIKNAIIGERDRIVLENQKLASKTAKVWQDLSSEVNNKISPVNFYTIVKCNRNNVWSDLSFNPETISSAKTAVAPSTDSLNEDNNVSDFHDQNSSDKEDGSDLADSNVRQEFTITLSSEEWNSIAPLEVNYAASGRYDAYRFSRAYQVLRPGVWTEIINEHFWEHTSLPCALMFKRAKVYSEGNNYVVIHGHCKECEAKFFGKIKSRPHENSRVHIHCSYSGNFEVDHTEKYKRPLARSARKAVAEKMNKEYISPSMIRRVGATKLMKFGNKEPSHLPSLNVLRVAKCESKNKERIHSNPIIALGVLKYIPPYENYIQDIGFDKFFIHYYSSTQMLLYRAHSQINEFPKVSIDATGGLVKRLPRSNGRKSAHILLYEVTVHEKDSNTQYSVCSMLSERQDTISIYHWLAMWTKRGAVIPKEAVTDMSLAILSAVVRAFTEFPSLSLYIEWCFNKLKDNNVTDCSCFLRCDIAHVVKLVCSWPALRGKNKRVREFYIRSIVQVISSSDLEDIRKILEAIISVALSETEGYLPSELPTICETSKSFLKERIAVGYTDAEALASEEEIRTTMENSENADILTDEISSNPFHKWILGIIEKCKACVALEEGDRDNLQFLPEIVLAIEDFVKFLPLCTGIMIPIFGYGDAFGTSAASESNFNDLKTRVFGKKTLPLRVDEFLTTHITSLEGIVRLAHCNYQNVLKLKTSLNNHPQTSQPPATKTPTPSDAHLPLRKRKITKTANMSSCSTLPAPSQSSEGSEKTVTACPACSAGNLPTGAHVCRYCKVPVHVFEECSHPLEDAEEGYGQERICFNCSKNVNLKEDTAIENWQGLGKSQQKRRKFLDPCPDYRFVDLRSKSISTHIGLLRNGGTIPDKGSLLKTTVKGKRISLTNTCSFDSLVQVLCSSFSDSCAFNTFVNSNIDEQIFQLVKLVVERGVTMKAYTLRAEILMNFFKVKHLPSGIVCISTESTITSMCTLVLNKFPSIKTISKCQNVCCGEELVHNTVVLCVVLQFKDDIKKLQSKVDATLQRRQSCESCNEDTTVTTSPINNHIIIEIILLDTRIDQSSDVASDLSIALNDIPEKINISGICFELRGTVGFLGGSKRLSAIGHYLAFCRRPDSCWEVYDDTSVKKSLCSRTSKQNCQLLFYTQ